MIAVLLLAGRVAADPVESAVDDLPSLPPTPAVFLAEADASRVALRDNLTAMNNGTLPESVSATGLFGVSLDDRGAVATRIGDLEASRDAFKQRTRELKQRLDALANESKADVAVPAPAVPSPSIDASKSIATPAPQPAPAPSETLPSVPLATPDPANPEAPATSPVDDAAAAQAARAVEQVARVAEEERLARIATEELRVARDAAEAAARLERQRARDEQMTAIKADMASVRLDLEIIDQRLTALTNVSQRFDAMTEAGRRIIPILGAERKSLREHASLIAQLGSETKQLALGLQRLSTRSDEGLLVGFISARTALARESESIASMFAKQSEQFDEISASLIAIAEEVESAGAELRGTILQTLVVQTRQSELDELFLSHLRTQRRLRKTVSHVLTAPSARSIENLRDNVVSALRRADEVGTIADARTALESVSELNQRVDSVLSAELASGEAWRLAFENEVVTVLSEQATESTRTKAYGLSTEIVDDVLSEIRLSIERFRQEVAAIRSDIPTASALVATSQGQSYLLRAAALLALLGGCLFAIRSTSRITVVVVRGLARVRFMRDQIGLIVRWSGLIQSVLPSVLALVALFWAIAVTGQDSTAAEHLRVLLLPLILYTFGQQLLVGATRRKTRGRPALIEVEVGTLARLQKTYATVGMVVALGSMLDGLARIAVGAGRLVSLVDAAVLAWVGIWLVWEAIRWRGPLARAWAKAAAEGAPDSVERRLANWMAESRLGFVLSPVVLLRFFATAAAGLGMKLATRTDVMQRLRAQILRRRSKQASVDDDASARRLPAEYLDAFPLHPVLGEDDSLLVPREELLVEVLEQVQHWQESKVDGSLVLVGEKGSGKTTLAALIGKRTQHLDVVHHTITGKPGTRAELMQSLSTSLGGDGINTLDDLRVALCAGPERVVMLDEAHNVFLRRVDGYEAYDALVELVNGTSSKVFWVVIFNSFTWRFLNESRGRVLYFRKLLFVPNWSPEEIQLLVGLRNKRTGFELEFDSMLRSDERSNGKDLELVEGSDGYFRLLWESSGGNPRIATQLWLASLTLISERKLRVGLFRQPSTEVFSTFGDDLFFALSAFCQHENLSAAELAVVLNVAGGFAMFLTQYLSEVGMIEFKDERLTRYTLTPEYYRAVQRALRLRHLLFE